jgi:hypothetical protein
MIQCLYPVVVFVCLLPPDPIVDWRFFVAYPAQQAGGQGWEPKFNAAI